MHGEQRLKIAVLMGGVSNEREVSLKSGREVAGALAMLGHEVIPLDLKERSILALESLRPDAAFLALHGEWGEDGGVQELLEEAGIPYTGSGPEASRLAFNKLASKRAFVRHSVGTPDYFVLEDPMQADQAARGARLLRWPVVCKPSRGGSSIGVSICRGPDETKEGVAGAFRESKGPDKQFEPVLIERCVLGRELTVGVLDGKALPVVEVRSRRAFFDYRAKYEDKGTIYSLDVPIPRSVYARVQELALQAYEALGCRHMGRTDMILAARDGKLYALEVNTIPGFTPRSLLPMAAAAAGIAFPQLCERLVRLALHEAAQSPHAQTAARDRRRSA
ncbi:MAG: D-alanine--D-alanine ligase [Candidatus Brocadiia bacterium]|nr:D-alanine--D-alanine ligase [Candidatus Brocadiia bacterium]